MKKHIYLFFLLVSTFSFAQQTVSGTIIDAAGESLIGATVLEKGTDNGTVSDYNGNFELTVAGDATLVVSYTGFAGVEMAVDGQRRLDITLTESTETLDEVVITGFSGAVGRARKRVESIQRIPESVTAINSEDIEKNGVGNVTDFAQLVPNLKLSESQAVGVNFLVVWAAEGNGTMTTLEAISIITGTSILMPVFMPDFSRFAKKDRDALFGALGLAIGTPLILIAGAAPSILTGEEDIMKIMIGLSLTIPAFFILIFSTWTTNVVNLYSAILVFSTLNKKWKFWVIGVVSSIIATVLAILGFSTYFIDMLTFVSLVVPSLASIFILHYFFVGKGNYDVAQIAHLPAYDWQAFLAWGASSLVAIATHNNLFQLTTIPFIDAFLTGLVFYGIILKFGKK